MRRALIVDDDPSLTEALRRSLRGWGFNFVEIAYSGGSALALLSHGHYELVLLDVHFDGDWRAVLAAAQASDPPAAVLMMSGVGDIKTAVESLRLGASDFIEKPIEPSVLRVRLDRAVGAAGRPPAEPSSQRGRGEAKPPPSHSRVHSARVRERISERVSDRDPTSAVMKSTLALADRVASTPASSALIVGESGVGKEVLAARIHERSARREGPFVRVNLAAIPATVIEAELFGNTRGAFTDAKRDRVGYLASADGGTILLDEIGEFRLDLQAKLLRAIEERRFYPVGSDRERAINVRILAATNRDPDDLVQAKILRADLFYRLGTLIRIPPLRERIDEVIPLANEFVAHFCQEFGRSPCRLGEEATEELLRHAWPGNIRELRNVIERAVMMCEGDTIGPGLIEPTTKPRHGVPPLQLRDARGRSVDEVEREHILRVLKLAGDSKSAAAHLLGVSRSTLYEKMKRYGIER
ncbi:MAG: sigma-54-dependent Fis family transcriptional regulator [Labilithrix sp.]|nr:sigma-54-dependent Fis family transcriptional regulator [Labilithrix sp.]MCW5815030.1 sigma-54-dependent Fis family transcriptional regulator [Labilithrix sp.]